MIKLFSIAIALVVFVMLLPILHRAIDAMNVVANAMN